jgi:hypothetical protein
MGDCPFIVIEISKSRGTEEVINKESTIILEADPPLQAAIACSPCMQEIPTSGHPG